MRNRKCSRKKLSEGIRSVYFVGMILGCLMLMFGARTVWAVESDKEEQEIPVIGKCSTVMEGITTKSDAVNQRMRVSWKEVSNAAGYDLTLFSPSGKKSKEFHANGEDTYFWLPKIRSHAFYRVKMRPYFLTEEGRVNGTCINTYIAQQPRVTYQWVSKNKAHALWQEVQGAKDYTLYVSRHILTGYKKIGTVQELEQTIEKLKPKVKYYGYVTANMRKDGKVYRTPRTFAYPFIIQP